MSLFDYVMVECPLPKTAPKWINELTLFQTKETDAQFMECYTITLEGRLIHHSVDYEAVPEKERPYWGTPTWDKSAIAKMCGSIRHIPTGDVDTNFHGDLHISASSESQPYEFYNLVVRFTNGKVESMKEGE